MEMKVLLQTTPVFLTPEDITAFRLFREYQDRLELLQKCGFFGVKNGQATVSFNADGVITDIELRQRTFRR